MSAHRRSCEGSQSFRKGVAGSSFSRERRSSGGVAQVQLVVALTPELGPVGVHERARGWAWACWLPGRCFGECRAPWRWCALTESLPLSLCCCLSPSCTCSPRLSLPGAWGLLVRFGWRWSRGLAPLTVRQSERLFSRVLSDLLWSHRLSVSGKHACRARVCTPWGLSAGLRVQHGLCTRSDWALRT